MTAFVVLGAAGVVSWLLRVAFVTVVPSSNLPSVVRRALEGVGPAALAALVATELSTHARATGAGGPGALLVAAVLAGAVAWWTKKPILTVIVGIGTFWVLLSVTA